MGERFLFFFTFVITIVFGVLTSVLVVSLTMDRTGRLGLAIALGTPSFFIPFGLLYALQNAWFISDDTLWLQQFGVEKPETIELLDARAEKSDEFIARAFHFYAPKSWIESLAQGQKLTLTDEKLIEFEGWEWQMETTLNGCQSLQTYFNGWHNRTWLVHCLDTGETLYFSWGAS